MAGGIALRENELREGPAASRLDSFRHIYTDYVDDTVYDTIEDPDVSYADKRVNLNTTGLLLVYVGINII